MTNHVVVTAFVECSIVFRRNIHRTITCSASAWTTMRTSVLVKHKVPHYHRLAPACHGTNTGILHLRHERLTKALVVPCTDRLLGEVEVLLWCLFVNSIQLHWATTIAVICRTINILACFRISIYLYRILQLVFLAIIIVVMVKADDLSLDTLALEHRAESQLDEITLLIPRHIQRHRVTPVEWLVLRGYAGNMDTLCLKSLDPLHEVHRIILIIVWIEITTYPLVRATIRCFAPNIIHLHPYWAAPWCTHHFQIRIDSQNLLQHRDDIIHFVGCKTKVLNSLRIATSVVIIATRVEVATANRHAHITISHTLVRGEGLHQQFLTTVNWHLHQVKRRSTCDSSTKAIKLLVTHIRIERQCALRRHIKTFRIILTDRHKAHRTICRGDIGHYIAYGDRILIRFIAIWTFDRGIAAEQRGRNTYK